MKKYLSFICGTMILSLTCTAMERIEVSQTQARHYDPATKSTNELREHIDTLRKKRASLEKDLAKATKEKDKALVEKTISSLHQQQLQERGHRPTHTHTNSLQVHTKTVHKKTKKIKSATHKIEKYNATIAACEAEIRQRKQNAPASSTTCIIL